jgi:GNAT superfamily N-acetyltransferase
MSVRRIEFVDFPELYHLLTELITKGPLDRTRMETTFREIIGDPMVRIGVFDDGQEILGMVSISVHSTLHHFGRVAVIDEMVVHEKARMQGVGKELMNWARMQAKQLGIDTIELHSDEFRSDAHAFYKSLGFEHKGSVFSLKL